MGVQWPGQDDMFIYRGMGPAQSPTCQPSCLNKGRQMVTARAVAKHETNKLALTALWRSTSAKCENYGELHKITISSNFIIDTVLPTYTIIFTPTDLSRLRVE